MDKKKKSRKLLVKLFWIKFWHSVNVIPPLCAAEEDTLAPDGTVEPRSSPMNSKKAVVVKPRNAANKLKSFYEQRA